MPRDSRGNIARTVAGAAATVVLLLLAGCDGSSSPTPAGSTGASANRTGSTSGSPAASGGSSSGGPASSGSASGGSSSGGSSSGGSASGGSGPATATPSELTGVVRLGFAGDVHFTDRTAKRLAANPATVFGPAATSLAAPDLMMLNLETAIAVGGTPENKNFTFQAPPSAFTALRAAGIDLVTMANNHAADYGSAGLAQTLAAIKRSGFPVVGLGANANAAYAPYYTEINGVRLAFVAALQVREETLANFSATSTSPGVASAYNVPRLVAAVKAAKAKADAVIVYLHWGTEYVHCPNEDQYSIADKLSAAGATAVVGTHAHGLQGAGWRPDGTYVSFGLGNYFWWISFGDQRDDSGILTLTLTYNRVTGASFAPARLDDRGIAVPATGATARRIRGDFEEFRQCAGLLAKPPR
ncbi:CapA family protein [Jatrophihabitans sp.]|uniref:CapA family protein n=1 Tax=Jatrophihabitans sp. TaxID=1932789 RepID=UPI002F180D20